MDELQVTARLAIHDGKLEEFKAVAAECLRTVREEDSGTLQYDWFFSEDESECVVRERYRDSDAVLEHIANLGDTFDALLGVADLSLEVCGDPSPELMEASEGLDVTVYRYFQGLRGG